MNQKIALLALLILVTSCQIQLSDDGYYIDISEEGYYFGYEEQPKNCEPQNYIRRVMLEQMNAIRTRPQICGHQSFAATEPITWNTRLWQAAAHHAEDMARYDFLSHLGSDSSSVAIRVNNQGYLWLQLGESIGADYQSPDNMILYWLNNSTDCATLMNPNYTEMGVACASRDDLQSQYMVYWTLVLAKPSQIIP